MTADTAVVTMRAHDPTETLRFYNRVHQAFYADAVDVTDAGAYPPLLEGFDIDATTFVEALKSEGMNRLTWQGFVTAHRMGVTGFPTLLLRDGSVGHILTSGYAPYKPIEEVIRGFLAEQ